jgi:hypothetical protein
MPQSSEKVAVAINEIASIGRLRPGTVRVAVRKEIRAEELHAALDRILELHGCPACGLNGLDILFRHQLPIQDAFRDIKNVAAVEQIMF